MGLKVYANIPGHNIAFTNTFCYCSLSFDSFIPGCPLPALRLTYRSTQQQRLKVPEPMKIYCMKTRLQDIRFLIRYMNNDFQLVHSSGISNKSKISWTVPWSCVNLRRLKWNKRIPHQSCKGLLVQEPRHAKVLSRYYKCTESSLSQNGKPL